MIDVRKDGKTLFVNERKIEFEQGVDDFVILEDRVIVELAVHDFAVGDPLVGRNILAFDKDGELLWRIPATGVLRDSASGINPPEAFFGLWLDDDGVLKTTTIDGFTWDLDPDNGKISNSLFTK